MPIEKCQIGLPPFVSSDSTTSPPGGAIPNNAPTSIQQVDSTVVAAFSNLINNIMVHQNEIIIEGKRRLSNSPPKYIGKPFLPLPSTCKKGEADATETSKNQPHLNPQHKAEKQKPSEHYFDNKADKDLGFGLLNSVKNEKNITSNPEHMAAKLIPEKTEEEEEPTTPKRLLSNEASTQDWGQDFRKSDTIFHFMRSNPPCKESETQPQSQSSLNFEVEKQEPMTALLLETNEEGIARLMQRILFS